MLARPLTAFCFARPPSLACSSFRALGASPPVLDIGTEARLAVAGFPCEDATLLGLVVVDGTGISVSALAASAVDAPGGGPTTAASTLSADILVLWFVEDGVTAAALVRPVIEGELDDVLLEDLVGDGSGW